MAGTLYVVATPIGNLADLSPRAVAILRQVDAIACEDTRHSRPLLQHFAIEKPLLALHQHNERGEGEKLLARLQTGENLALISDAGTPLISDPGATLVRRALEQHLTLVPVAGPSSVMAALSVAGQSADEFIFAGFIPSAPGAREKFLQGYQRERRTAVFFETPHRIAKTLALMDELFAPARSLTICRELSKQFEQIQLLPVSAAAGWLAADPQRARGEFVLVLAGAEVGAEPWEDWARDLAALGLPAKAIGALLHQRLGANKKAVYDFLLAEKEA